jgi:nucleoside-diphosphate-sugar epimerase
MRNLIITSGKSDPIIDPELARLQQYRLVLSVTKAERLLGYKPKVTFNEGCRRTFAWLHFAYGMNLDP